MTMYHLIPSTAKKVTRRADLHLLSFRQGVQYTCDMGWVNYHIPNKLGDCFHSKSVGVHHERGCERTGPSWSPSSLTSEFGPSTCRVVVLFFVEYPKPQRRAWQGRPRPLDRPKPSQNKSSCPRRLNRMTVDAVQHAVLLGLP